MFVPFISETLSRRRGGGAHGGGRSGSSSGKSDASSSSSRSSLSTTSKSVPISGTSRTVAAYSSGGGKVLSIPANQPFAGRAEGGATRDQIWGSRTYGSGYPGYYSRGVTNRGFPFYFWPLVWGTGIGYGENSAYMYDSDEYGQPDNTTRPGGPQATAAFQSNSTTSTPTTLRVISDNTTVAQLMAAISANCSAYLLPSSITNTTTALPTPFNSSALKPEETIQYYRASSVALTLDGYNNTAVFTQENSTADSPLPAGIDTNMLECVNTTIGLAVPLVSSGYATVPASGLGLLIVLATAVLRALLIS